MNWLNRVAASGHSLLRSAPEGSKLHSQSLRESREVIELTTEIDHLKMRVVSLNDKVEELKVVEHTINYCKACNYNWLDTLHDACPSCNSGDSSEIGWFQNWEDLDDFPEPPISEVAPAAGGGARSATEIKEGGKE